MADAKASAARELASQSALVEALCAAPEMVDGWVYADVELAVCQEFKEAIDIWLDMLDMMRHSGKETSSAASASNGETAHNLYHCKHRPTNIGLREYMCSR